MLKRTFIIIATYNAMPWISRCLKSCETYNVIIVDNNSTDATVKFIQQNHPSITLIQQIKNLGFGAANNIGISYALKEGADYVFLLNQDAYLESNSIEKLIEVHKKNKAYGIISPIHLNGNGNNLDNNFSNYLVKNKVILFDSLRNKYTKAVYDFSFVNAAAWLLPKETLLNIGGFDPIFFHYGEDENYCHRVLFHGYKIGIVPNTFVKHDRENRNVNCSHDFKVKLKLRERILKCKWSNLNIEIEDSIKKTKRNQLKLIVRTFLKLRIKNTFQVINEYHLIKHIIPEIKMSRKINRERGNHYIN